MNARPDRLHPTRRALPATLLGLAAAARAQLPAGDDPEASPRWQAVRAALFGNRPIDSAPGGQVVLTAPRRADDPAFVPMALRSTPGTLHPDTTQSVQRLTLVIDNNPSPVAAVIDLPPDGALPDIETRTRVDEYTFVRAIAETRDGRLLMATRFVKASGGCSAPPGGDDAAVQAAMGRMLWRADPAEVSASLASGTPLTVQWMVHHPNHSGLAMNQATRQFTPAQFVRSMRLWQGERLLLSAEVDFALSENPTLRFRFVPRGTGELRAEAIDTFDRRFSGSIALKDLR
ncbi:quinoprotein dehydrogenase-associated SoxYZ-like carrier [uncultured Sphaerotilus sp.]|uniref:quinoprotein dehydrogenase-associated SoxYZ-like carrier n=1 Tax=uncultured Sphaerotilus sp. TaxID=474984 RepID=UPI0030CA1D15